MCAKCRKATCTGNKLISVQKLISLRPSKFSISLGYLPTGVDPFAFFMKRFVLRILKILVEVYFFDYQSFRYTWHFFIFILVEAKLVDTNPEPHRCMLHDMIITKCLLKIENCDQAPYWPACPTAGSTVASTVRIFCLILLQTRRIRLQYSLVWMVSRSMWRRRLDRSQSSPPDVKM